MSADGGISGEELGTFAGEVDVGRVHAPGRTRFDPRRGEYRITGGGANMWDRIDAFHFVHRRVEGDLVLTAKVRLLPGRNAHRKAGWMVRQNLEPDAPYADAIVHGDGLLSLQYRLEKGGETREVQWPGKAPAGSALRFERHGDLFTLSVSPPGNVAGTFVPVGSVSVPLGDEVEAGLAVCSHEARGLATALFSDVAIDNPGVVPAGKRVLECRLEVITVPGGQRRVVYQTRDHIEAPNWSRDGKELIFNSKGRLYRIAAEPAGTSPTPTVIDTGVAKKLNNDHGLSPDGKWLAISDEPNGDSLIFVLPAAGGQPRQVTARGPSYWHGWSPDGKTLAYCASRNGEYDVYTIAADATSSTEEKRLTSNKGLDDGPDYSPDGKSIYFNSDRTGQMHVYQMNVDGSEQRQLTRDEWADWFPHPSPDGKWLIFVSYDKSVEGHPPNKDVALRLMPVPAREGRAPKVLARLFGGQGTLNVPSWSPDSRQVAFVSYRLVKA